MIQKACYILAVFYLIAISVSPPWAQSQTRGVEPKQIEVKSGAFENEGMIPKVYTCAGKDISPPISWTGAPRETKSIVLIMDDPDAPGGTWTHWVIFNIPPETQSLAENVPRTASLPNGAVHAANSWGKRKMGYGGPCPPSGTHRYYFKIYALDTKLNLPPGAPLKNVQNAMKNHILAQGQLMGRYKK